MLYIHPAHITATKRVIRNGQVGWVRMKDLSQKELQVLFEAGHPYVLKREQAVADTPAGEQAPVESVSKPKRKRKAKEE